MTTEILNTSTFDELLKEELNKDSNKVLSSVLPVVLLSDHVEVEIHKGVKKLISYTSFKEIINRSLNEVNHDVEITGMSPPSNMIFLSQNDSSMHINCYYSGGNRTMLYNETKLDIVAPNVIIGYTLKKEGADWLVSAASYFCTDLAVSKLPRTFINTPDHNRGIYDLPMSNTYGGGAMCYGNNTMPVRFKDNNLRGLDWYYRFLWETPFNNDLGIRAIGDKVGVKYWYEGLVEFAKEGKPFPYRDLHGYQRLESSPPEGESLTKRILNR